MRLDPGPRREASRLDSAGEGAFLDDVLAGLEARPRTLPSRHLYDARGSHLFQWITNLPEYYLTRIERAILARHAGDIAAPMAGRRCSVVDLGAGDGHKTRLLLERLARDCPRVLYAPVDLSEAALGEAAGRVREELPGVETLPVHAEHLEALRILEGLGDGSARLVLFLGSSIGNMEHAESGAFLAALRRALRPGDHVLVGFDLVKPLAVVRPAYDDASGVTRAFNQNLLARMNRELGADFDLEGFLHRATWDPGRPAMESWLESRRRQVVHLAGRTFEIGRRERIHTEISCKYGPGQISGFARGAGFTEVERFRDERGWFADALWRVD